MAVQHDQDFLLTVAVDTSHGDIDVVVAVDDMHAWDVGCQHLLEIPGPGVAYHLLCYQGGGHWYLHDRLLLAGGRCDRCRHALLYFIDYFNEAWRVFHGGRVVGVFL